MRRPTLRVLQFIRSRIVWRSIAGPDGARHRRRHAHQPGSISVSSPNPVPQGGLVAKQKPIEVGQLIGNDYVVRSGLKAGETLIVSGIQKIGDGAPVRAE